MKKTICLGVLFGICWTSLACAQKADETTQKAAPSPKVTRQYLLAHGFKELAKDPDVFTREHVRLRDVSRDLQFPLKHLRPTVNAERSNDVMVADVAGVYVIVRSEVPYSKSPMDGLLGNPDTICTARVSLRQAPPVREYQKTDNSPRLHIKSVVMPEDRLKPWRITFDLAATGKKPVAILQRHFHVRVIRKSPSWDSHILAIFPKDTPEIITVLPGEPVVFTVNVPPDAIPEDLFSSGEYALQVVVSAMKRHDQTVDYEWQGEGHSSDKYEFTIR